MGLRFLVLISCAVFVLNARAAITGLSFSHDTINGWNCNGEPHRLVIHNYSQEIIRIDSVLVMDDYCMGPLYYHMDGTDPMYFNNWQLFAAGAFCRDTQRPFYVINPEDSLALDEISELSVYISPILGKAFQGSSDFRLIMFCSGAETDTVIFFGIGIIIYQTGEGPAPAPAQSGLSIFPNPAREEVRLGLPQGADFGEVEIFNVRGERVVWEKGIRGDEFVWRTANIINGVYLVRGGEGKRGWKGKVVVYR